MFGFRLKDTEQTNYLGIRTNNIYKHFLLIIFSEVVMTIESSRLQIPTASPNPVLNVQNEIQKGVTRDENKTNSANNTNRQVMASSVVNEPKQQEMNVSKVSDGRVDIKI